AASRVGLWPCGPRDAQKPASISKAVPPAVSAPSRCGRRQRQRRAGQIKRINPQMPNFTALDMSLPEVATLVAAMVQARDAVSRRSWSHPQEPTGEEWWADVLADARARKRERRTDLAVKQAFYRLADEKREIILVACSKCDWRAAFLRDDLI